MIFEVMTTHCDTQLKRIKFWFSITISITTFVIFIRV